MRSRVKKYMKHTTGFEDMQCACLFPISCFTSDSKESWLLQILALQDKYFACLNPAATASCLSIVVAQEEALLDK